MHIQRVFASQRELIGGAFADLSSNDFFFTFDTFYMHTLCIDSSIYYKYSTLICISRVLDIQYFVACYKWFRLTL